MAILFLIFSICLHQILPHSTFAAILTEHEHQKIEEILLNEEENEYIISIGVKFSDGSEVWSEKEFKAENKEFSAHKVYNVEDILLAANGIHIKYIKNSKVEKAFRVEPKNMDLFEKAQFEGGYVEFEANIDQAIVIKRMEDGTLQKVIKKDVKFHRKKGQQERIWELFKEIQKFDDRWHLPGDGEDTHGAYKGNQQFDVILDGHAMVTLSLPDGKDENGKEKLREIVRYHFNASGLNIYLKDGNYNFVMESSPHGFVRKEIAVQRKRGKYLKEEFRPRLWSKKMSILEMNKIAFEVVDGRSWGGEFKCRHFVYEFVQSIVAPNDKEHLKNFDAWPKVQCILNDLQIQYDSGRSAFKKSVLDRYLQPADVHAAAGPSKNAGKRKVPMTETDKAAAGSSSKKQATSPKKNSNQKL